jgi:hypothetical protein
LKDTLNELKNAIEDNHMRQLEQKLLFQYKEIRTQTRIKLEKTDQRKEADMLSDISYFTSDKGRSDLTTDTE